MRLDRATLQAGVLIAWAAFLAWLWISGETLRYLGPRTQWLVPFGAVTLTVAAVTAVRAARNETAPARIGLGEAGGLLALLTPIAAAFLLANAQLGAQAASKKLTSRGIDASALADLAAAGSGPVDFLQLSVAAKDSRFARQNGLEPGKAVRLTGFVSKPGTRTFELSRFYITCCVADSIPIGTTIVAPRSSAAGADKDRWLQVDGRLIRRERTLAVQADRVRRVNPPDNPYLSVAR